MRETTRSPRGLSASPTGCLSLSVSLALSDENELDKLPISTPSVISQYHGFVEGDRIVRVGVYSVASWRATANVVPSRTPPLHPPPHTPSNFFKSTNFALIFCT